MRRAFLSLVGTLTLVEQVSALSAVLPSRNSNTANTMRSTLTRAATSYAYHTIIDGPCWEYLRDSPLMSDTSVASSIGALPVVTGTLETTQEDVVGLLADQEKEKETLALASGQVVWKESIARFPKGIKAEEAAATYATALTHLYPLTAAQLSSVGGSEETFNGVSVPKGSVVILGGNPEAVWAAQALATLGSDVTLVSPNKPSSLPKSVNVLTPNDADTFSETVGKFEALLDTVGREGQQSRAVRMLASRHGCMTYRSTRTKAEEIVGSEGLLWGPGKAKEYLKSLDSKVRNAASSTLPVTGLGALVEELLQAKLVAPVSSLETVASADRSTTWVRGWSLKGTWEANTWPSNTDGTRYGFPTLDDDDDDEFDEYIVRRENLPSRVKSRSETAVQDQEAKRVGTRSQMQPSSTSPYVMSVYGTEGLEKDIVEPELDCILFMSAPFCRTCRKLQAPYARLARLNSEDEDSEVVFAKADVVGSFGKALGKSLDVNAVPCFLLFRKGERFGKALNISKLPHPQLDLALQYLKQREDWDDNEFESEENLPQTKI